MDTQVTFKNKHGEKLVGILHVPEKPNGKGVILSHCFTCSKHHPVMKKLATCLSHHGYTTLRFDFSGNGESEGKFEDSTYSKQREDLGYAIDFFLSKGITSLGLAGHSMGAAVSILHAVKDNRIKTVCVLGSQSDTSRIKQYLTNEQLDEVYDKGSLEITIFHRKFTVKKEFFEDSKQQHLHMKAEKLKQPLCIIHGEKDVIVDPKNAERLYAYKKEPKQLHIIKNADHFFSAHFREVDKIVLGWFNGTL